MPSLVFSSVKAASAMELKFLLIVVLFLGACAGFSLPDEQEDPLNEDEAQELEEMNNDEAENDFEDPSKVVIVKPFCPKGNVRRCFIVKHCYRKLRICRCFPIRKYGDETEFDEQVNDEMVETPEEFDEDAQELEDPSKKVPRPRPRCPKRLIRKCFLVKYGYRRRLVCTCVRPCRYGDETEADYY